MAELDWTLWRSFVAVLRDGSLSRAARRLGLTQPTVGRHIDLLEQGLGAVLFIRSNDGLTPTALALSLRAQAEAMGAAAAHLSRIASGEAEAAAGQVRLTASEFVGREVLPALLATFLEDHPAIDVEVVLTDQNLDLLRNDADLAIRNAAPTQTQLVARKIGTVPIRFYAHRRYAERHGLPDSLEALMQHRLIGWAPYAARVPALAALPLRFAFSSPNDAALVTALRAGIGIGGCQAVVAAGEPDLLPVLPDFTLMDLPIWLAMHEEQRVLRRVRLLFDHLAEGLGRYVGGAGASEGR